MREWREFRLWYAINPNPNDLYEFKRTNLLPIVEKYSIEDFLILDEPKFVLLRIEVENEVEKQIESSLRQCVSSTPLFSELTVGNWSPTTDAKDRIFTARKRAMVPLELPAGGWMIKGKASDGKWVASAEDLDRQVRAFSTFMSRVVGKFTKAYIKEMPYRVEDRWLTSVFLHLILDSISIWQKEEDESREFPYV